MLDPFSRAAIVTMSVACIAGAVALAPARARGWVPGSQPISLAAVDRLGHTDVADTQVRRDPFSGEPADDGVVPKTPQAGLPAAPLSASTSPNAAPALSGSSLTQTGIPILPGNLGANAIPTVPGDAGGAPAPPRVTAVVTGRRSYAMLNDAGTTEIRGVGDRLEGVPITAIDINGITLAGGRRLIVAPDEGQR